MEHNEITSRQHYAAWQDACQTLLHKEAEIAELTLAEEGAKEAFGHVVEQKREAEKECMRLQGLLASAYADIRRAAQRV